MVAAAVRTVFAQPDAKHVHAQLDVIAGMLGRKFPTVEALLRDAGPDVLAFTGLPVAHCLVKATTQLVVVVQAEDALSAAQAALALAGRGLQAAGLGAPGSIVTVESEAVPAPAHDQVLRPHPAPGAAAGTDRLAQAGAARLKFGAPVCCAPATRAGGGRVGRGR